MVLKNIDSIIKPTENFNLEKNNRELQLQIIDYYRCLDTLDDDYDSDDEDMFSEERQKELSYESPMLIKAYAILESGNSITINLRGFQPFFYIKIPDNWNKKMCGRFVSKLREQVYYKYKKNLLTSHILIRKPFNEFTGDEQFKFLKLTFLNKESYDQFKWKLMKPLTIMGINKGKPYIYDLYESNIEPIIKFIHLSGIKPTGWVKVPKYKYQIQRERTTHTNFEINMKWNDLVSVDDRFDNAKINTAAYDIESDSSHGDFPIGIKDYQKLAQDLITMFNEYGINRKKKNAHRLFQENPKKVLETCLKLVFDDNFNNNGIHQIKTRGNLKPHQETIEQLAFAIYQIFNLCFENQITNDDVFEQVRDILEFNLPQIDMSYEDNSHYMLLAREIISQLFLLKRQKNKRFMQYPIEIIKLMLHLAFNDYFDGFVINCIYTKHNLKPDTLILESLVPDVFKILTDCANFIHYKKLPEPPVIITRDEMVYNEDNMSQDAFVKKLIELFDDNLPKIEGDKLIQIGTTFQILGEKDCYLKHIICLDTCDDFTNEDLIADENKDIYLPTNELAKDLINYEKHLGHLEEIDKDELKDLIKKKEIEIKGWDIDYRKLQCKKAAEYRRLKQSQTDNAKVVIEYYEHEKDVLMAWKELIIQNDPDVIIGYNIFGFDFKFLYERAIELDCVDDFCQLGRLRNNTEILYEQKLSSAGLGDNTLRYIPMNGRVIIDLYKVIQNGYKLNSYKLDSVCHKFLYKEKNDLPPQDIFIMQKGTEADRATIAKYCIIDCILCNRLLTKLEIVGNNIAMSNVCKVPLPYLFLRGQGVKIYSLVSDYCSKNGYLIPVLPRADPNTDDGYEGAIVLKPFKGIYFDPISVADFNSLYPSSMISENLSHDSFVEIGGKYDNLPGYEYVDIEYDIYKYFTKPGTKRKIKKKVGVKTCRYAQLPDGKKSVLPSILMALLAARKGAKKKMAEEKDPFKANIWNGLQLAYKVTANSLYGQCGARTSPIYKKEIAASTTAVGRNMIMFSKKYVEKAYKDVIITFGDGRKIHVKDTYCVYGDTDSIFIKFDCYTLDGEKLKGLDAVFASMELCIKSSKEISVQLKKPQNLEFEKVIYPFILISKKRYHGHYYTKMNVDSYYPNSMGIVLKRRDNAPIVKYVFGRAIDIIMKEHNIEKAQQVVKDESTKLLQGGFPMNQFIISKTLRSYYKKPNQIAHNVLAQRQAQRDPGNKFQSNDRVPYAYIIPPVSSKDLLQGDKIETPNFIEQNGLKIDYRMYLTNQIMKPVSQIFDLVMDGTENMFKSLIVDYEHELMGVVKIDSFFKKKETKPDIPKLFDIIEKARLKQRENQTFIDEEDDDDDQQTTEDEENDELVNEVEYYSNNYDDPNF